MQSSLHVIELKKRLCVAIIATTDCSGYHCAQFANQKSNKSDWEPLLCMYFVFLYFLPSRSFSFNFVATGHPASLHYYRHLRILLSWFYHIVMIAINIMYVQNKICRRKTLTRVQRRLKADIFGDQTVRLNFPLFFLLSLSLYLCLHHE